MIGVAIPPEKGENMRNGFTKAEIELITKAMLNIVYNGNHIEPKGIDTTPVEYNIAHDIIKKLERG